MPGTKKRKFVYAVVKGRQPGLYLDLDLCNAQVKGFPGALFKGFNDSNDATEYMRLHRTENRVGLVQEEKKKQQQQRVPVVPTGVKHEQPSPSPAAATTSTATVAYHPQIMRMKSEPSPTPPSSFKEHWDGIAASQELVPGSQEWKDWSQARTVAGSNRVRELVFVNGCTEIEGFQALSRLVGIAWPADTISGCQADIKQKLVNIFDLIDALEKKVTIPVWPPNEWEVFKKYTLMPQNRYSLQDARECNILSSFLQDFRSRARDRKLISNDISPTMDESDDPSFTNELSDRPSHSTLYVSTKSLKRRNSLEVENLDQESARKRPRPEVKQESPHHTAAVLLESLPPVWEDSPVITSMSDPARLVIKIREYSPPPSPPPSAQAPVEETLE